MAVISGELYFAKLDPKRPNAKFNSENPTWELQVRTHDKEVKKNWLEMGLNVKDVVPEEGAPYFRVNLRKKSIKRDGDKASPVEVVGGDLEPLDPTCIGNGSEGNVRIFQYTNKNPVTKQESIVSVLMGVQVTKLIKFKPKPRGDEFKKTDMDVIDPASDEGEDEDDTSGADVKVY